MHDHADPLHTVISKLRRLWEQERGWAIVARGVQRLAERLCGRWRARVAGWPGGFIGSAPRIIGTRFIHAGHGVSVGRHAWIEAISRHLDHVGTPRIEIGARFSASERLHIACTERVTINDDCLVGSAVHITDHNHGRYKGAGQSPTDQPPILRPLASRGPVHIGARVWIGDNCVILGPARIGDGSIVGANSVVTGDVPPGVIVCGAPARVVKIYNASSGCWEPAADPAPSPANAARPRASFP